MLNRREFVVSGVAAMVAATTGFPSLPAVAQTPPLVTGYGAQAVCDVVWGHGPAMHQVREVRLWPEEFRMAENICKAYLNITRPSVVRIGTFSRPEWSGLARRELPRPVRIPHDGGYDLAVRAGEVISELMMNGKLALVRNLPYQDMPVWFTGTGDTDQPPAPIPARQYDVLPDFPYLSEEERLERARRLMVV